MQIWDDKSSLNLPGPLSAFLAQNSGMMGTHDEVTRAYFSGSDVHCAVIQRSGGKGNRAGEGTIASAFFSHHQKSVICDAPPEEGQRYRKLVAFVGGLDLTKGAFAALETPVWCVHGRRPQRAVAQGATTRRSTA